MKKVIALVLSLVMVLGLLAGCGNKQNDSDKKNEWQRLQQCEDRRYALRQR